ncbi:MAG: PspC domain-containing protein [Chloroflexota bacterium]|jgi:phage shock protein C
MQQERLTRSETDKMIAGVCGGLAAHLGIDPVLVRLAFVVLLLASGIGFAIYVILWIVMPVESQVPAEIRVMNDQAAEDPSSLKNQSNPAATVGIILILLGAFFLLNQMGWIPGLFWPIVLIGAGIFYLIRRAR